MGFDILSWEGVSSVPSITYRISIIWQLADRSLLVLMVAVLEKSCVRVMYESHAKSPGTSRKWFKECIRIIIQRSVYPRFPYPNLPIHKSETSQTSHVDLTPIFNHQNLF
jgi:hypothetical protein